LDAANIKNPVVTFSDGEQLTSFLRATCVRGTRERSLEPGILFLDLDLPRGASFAVLEWLRDNRSVRQLRIVALSDTVESPRILRALDLGVSHFLGKRPTTSAVATHVKQALAERNSR
jgi:DNA-binding NarL/FixJ family response regulator